MNLNGNEWTTEPQILPAFPSIDNLSDVAVLDFLGSGTACIVYSSPISKHPLQYIDLMGSKKPHLFTGYHNNCGKEIKIEYKSSTFFYLEDKKAGNKWITKLPFAVHCISKVRSEDKIRQTAFTSTYSYRHGYFDYIEKEFRGFARVEQFDTEAFEQLEEDLHQPPVRSVSWYHTGAYFRKEKILHQCESEYFKNELFDECNIPEPILSTDFTAREMQEASRACKGIPLRTEIYADDNSDKAGFPYSVSQSTVEIRKIQPAEENKHASFLVIPSESISYEYERNPADPRISQNFVLEADEFGAVKKSLSIVYPRVARPTGTNAIPDKVWEGQNKMHIVYGEVNYTNDISEDSVYRLRLACESKSYEINGIPQPAAFFFTKEILKEKIAEINTNPGKEILFEQDFDGTAQKRLTAHTRGYFLKDDLSGPLVLGGLSSLAIPHKSYKLAFTKNLVTKYYGTKVTSQMLVNAKYVHSEGDEHWWLQQGDVIFPPNAKR